MRFQLDDTVRVVHLLEAEREVTGSSNVPPQPRVGDTATVVADVGEGLYLLEACTDDGVTLWMAEFAAEGMELQPRPRGSPGAPPPSCPRAPTATDSPQRELPRGTPWVLQSPS